MSIVRSLSQKENKQQTKDLTNTLGYSKSNTIKFTGSSEKGYVQIHFLLYQMCFWSASYVDISGKLDISDTVAKCPVCKDGRIESLPIVDKDALSRYFIISK
jgi:hypothetical protein